MDLDERIDALAGADPARRRALRTLAGAYDPDFEWRLVRGHRAVSGLWLSDESIRSQYVHLTDVLIGVLLDGGHDTALFLDKSGRPVAWMVDRLWPVLAPTFDETGAVSGWPARPALRFLNIDRLQWRDHLDPLGTGAINATGLPTEVADDLRRALLRRPGDATLEGDALHAAPTFLTGRSVLVIDEVRVGGSTVEIACGVLGRAFPDARFAGTQWMKPRLVRGRDGNERNNQLPVWYRHDTVLGRGIGDRDPESAMQEGAWRARAGRYFLSRPHEPDIDDAPGRMLRAEVGQLAAQALVGAITVVPSFDRDDCEARARFFTGMDLTELRHWREANDVHLNPE